MAYADILPQLAYSTFWSNPEGALSDDSNYAISDFSQGSLRLSNFSKSLPKDITINGIELYGSAFLSSSLADITISAYLSYDGLTAVSSTKSSTALTTSETVFILGGSTDLWGFTPKRPHLEERDFSVVCYNSASGLINLDYVYLRVHYTANSYLQGERSDFPDSLDAISKVTNGIGPEHQIKSEQVNKIGDCLYTIESTIIDGSNNVKSIGYPPGLKTAAFTVSVTGALVSGSLTAYFHGLKSTPNGAQVVTSPEFSSVSGTRLPFVSSNCFLISAIGWIVSGGSVVQAAHVTPRCLFIEKVNTSTTGTPKYDYVYSFGFTAVGENIFSTTSALTNDGFNGVYGTPYPVNNGSLIVKMFAVGRV